MQRNYPRMFSPADDQQYKDGFKFGRAGAKKSVVLYFGSTFHLRITINISFLINDLELN